MNDARVTAVRSVEFGVRDVDAAADFYGGVWNLDPVAEHDGALYVPCGYMDSWWGRLWKQWPAEAREDPRAVVRIEGKRYERTLVPVTAADPEAGPVLAKLGDKYGFPAPPPDMALSSEALLLFRLAPRA